MSPLLLLALLGCDPKQADSSADTAACEPDAPGRRLMRRLSHTEYNSTVLDLLGTSLAPADGFAADDRVEGFDNNADALDVSALLADDYRDAAEELAEEADLTALLPCSAESDGARACAESFLRSFGLRAFRRPLTDDDVARYLDLYDEVAAEDGFEEGVRWLIAALLQSPHFLYRMELGAQTEPGRFELSDWEIATELSCLLVGTMPDEELFAAAAAGTLRDPAGLAEQAARLAADPRATDGVANFVFDWLGLDELETVSRDAEIFPDLSDDVRVAVGRRDLPPGRRARGRRRYAVRPAAGRSRLAQRRARRLLRPGAGRRDARPGGLRPHRARRRHLRWAADPGQRAGHPRAVGQLGAHSSRRARARAGPVRGSPAAPGQPRHHAAGL